jgi:DNA-binding Xre family transcriptional regulator
MINNEVVPVAVSYKKLWKLLIDRDMKKKDLLAAAGISQSSLSKMKKNENVNMDIVVKVCKALNCDISDIVEIVDDEGLSK